MKRSAIAIVLLFAINTNAFEFSGDQDTQAIFFDHEMIKVRLAELTDLTYESINVTNQKMEEFNQEIYKLEQRRNDTLNNYMLVFSMVIVIIIGIGGAYYMELVNKRINASLDQFVKVTQFEKLYRDDVSDEVVVPTSNIDSEE